MCWLSSNAIRHLYTSNQNTVHFFNSVICLKTSVVEVFSIVVFVIMKHKDPIWGFYDVYEEGDKKFVIISVKTVERK